MVISWGRGVSRQKMIKGNKDRMEEGLAGGSLPLCSSSRGDDAEVNCGVNRGWCRLKVRPLLWPAGGPPAPRWPRRVLLAVPTPLARWEPAKWSRDRGGGGATFARATFLLSRWVCSIWVDALRCVKYVFGSASASVTDQSEQSRLFRERAFTRP